MVHYRVNKERRTVKCTLIDFPGGVVRKSVGIATCSPDDDWNEEVGKKIAFIRARKAEVGRNISEYQDDLKALDNTYKSIRGAIVHKIEKQKVELERLRSCK